ncbi:unnamed protein product [Spodoptera exigua]|nr:unnamed protein product [Spodoptera exigua]
MFPKTVKSETITRPVLANLKQKPDLKFNELINGSKVLSSINSSVVKLSGFADTLDNSNNHFERYKVENSVSLICSMGSNKYNDCNVINMWSKEDKLNDPLNVYSTFNLDEISNKSPGIIGSHSGSSTSSSSPRFNDNFGYNLYEEFISEIPTYLKQTVKTMEGDVIKNTKTFLKQLCIRECCYQEKEENLVKCMKSTKQYYTPRKVIVHNPMDFIRMSHVQQQSLFQQSPRLRRTLSESSSFPPSPVVASSSPATLHDIASSPESPLSIIVSDTPHYSYYPHRLN